MTPVLGLVGSSDAGAGDGDVVQALRSPRPATRSAARAGRGAADQRSRLRVGDRRRAPGHRERRVRVARAHRAGEEQGVALPLRRVVDAVALEAGGDAVADRDVAAEDLAAARRAGAEQVAIGSRRPRPRGAAPMAAARARCFVLYIRGLRARLEGSLEAQREDVGVERIRRRRSAARPSACARPARRVGRGGPA